MPESGWPGHPVTAHGLREGSRSNCPGSRYIEPKKPGPAKCRDPVVDPINAYARRKMNAMSVSTVSRGIGISARVGAVTDIGPIDENVGLLYIDITLTGARQVE